MSLNLYGYGALLLVCAALYGWGQVQSARLDSRDAAIERYKNDVATLQHNVDRARKTADDNAKAVKDLAADLDREAVVAARFERLARGRETELKNALRRIADAPAGDDGPVAPVLGRELDSLRREYAAATAADGGADRPPGGPGQ